jgi:mannitol-1-phosphate 5-dehydrogenase
MASRDRTFVGFGFGPIQAGLFLYEAFHSGNFRRLVVAEVMPDVVEAVRRHGNRYSVNVAHFDGVRASTIGPVEIYDPAVDSGRERLIEAVAEAEEMATAVPSVTHYASASPGSIHRLLAEGLRRKAARSGPRAIIYAAENHNHAAELLEQAVLKELPAPERAAVPDRAQFLNTVIGKMSGVVEDAGQADRFALAPMAPGARRAFLVEAFNRILISRIDTGRGFSRGIAVFEEKDDLLPFEEAKLYGHNATHALAAYVAALRGVERLADLTRHPHVLGLVRDAFLDESGAALVRKHRSVDPLFTPEGYRAYADDLLRRMTNPFLLDTVERVGRDPRRKLGWNDRLIGTIRTALAAGVTPCRYAFGAVAALARLDKDALGSAQMCAELLDEIWRADSPDHQERAEVLGLLERERLRLAEWRHRGFPALRALFARPPASRRSGR